MGDLMNDISELKKSDEMVEVLLKPECGGHKYMGVISRGLSDNENPENIVLIFGDSRTCISVCEIRSVRAVPLLESFRVFLKRMYDIGWSLGRVTEFAQKVWEERDY